MNPIRRTAQLDAIVSDREVRKDTVEPGQNVGQTERLSTLQRESDRSPTDQREVETGPLKSELMPGIVKTANNTDTASATVDDMAVEKETYQDKQGPIGAFGEETAQGGQREPIDSYEKKTVQEDKRDPVESSFSGLNITTGASAPSSAASAPSGGFALAPPLGVFTETTPVASGASVILPGTVLPPAKREPPVEILPVQESQIPEPMLGRPAADPSIAFEDVTPRGNLELHNETVDASPAIVTREQRMDAPEAVLGDSAFGSSAAAPEAQEKDHDVPSYLSSRATSTHESIPSGKLDQPSAARMDSSASVTAVKHGHLGDHHHRDVETPRTTLDTVSEKGSWPVDLFGYIVVNRKLTMIRPCQTKSLACDTFARREEGCPRCRQRSNEPRCDPDAFYPLERSQARPGRLQLEQSCQY
jgi:hypothetical protein